MGGERKHTYQVSSEGHCEGNLNKMQTETRIILQKKMHSLNLYCHNLTIKRDIRLNERLILVTSNINEKEQRKTFPHN